MKILVIISVFVFAGLDSISYSQGRSVLPSTKPPKCVGWDSLKSAINRYNVIAVESEISNMAHDKMKISSYWHNDSCRSDEKDVPDMYERLWWEVRYYLRQLKVKGLIEGDNRLTLYIHKKHNSEPQVFSGVLITHTGVLKLN